MTEAGNAPAMEPTDIELMLRVQQGDVAAFRTLVFRYREPLRRFFASLLADRSQADDFAQETFLRLWLSRERYVPTGRFSTYLFGIGKHYWLNANVKRCPAQPRVVSEDAVMAVAAPPAVQPERVLLEQFEAARVRKAIADLPAHYRDVFAMSHFDGLKYAEIACRLGIPVGTVKSRMAEAVRRLRQTLRSRDGEGE